MGNEQSWGHRQCSFPINSKFCLSLRLRPWGCNPAAFRQHPRPKPSFPAAPQLGPVLWQRSHVCRCKLGAGGGWGESLWACLFPCSSPPPPLSQAKHHLRTGVGLLFTCWSPRAPNKHSLPDRQVSTKLPTLCQATYSFTYAQMMSSHDTANFNHMSEWVLEEITLPTISHSIKNP